ncbi:MAG TPA: allantoinase AllB [Tepidisphaeraceae bacterium]
MSRFDLIIAGGAVVRSITPSPGTPGEGWGGGVVQADIAITDGKIVEVAPSIAGSARERIEAGNLVVFPGLIDSHVHFNQPGRTDWEGIATGSSALAAGGGTCFFDMPLNSSPPVLDGAAFDAKKRAAERSSVTDFGLWGGLTPINLDRMEELAARGVVGFKAFMCPSGIDDFPYADLKTLEHGMRTASKLGLPVAVHAENPQLLEESRAKATGKSWADYLNSRPVLCEAQAVGMACACAKLTGCSLHVVHVSSPLVLDIIAWERAHGTDVTCETCPHYFLLHDEDVPRIGARAKCAPPLRSSEESRLLAARLREQIDFVASDHSPAPPSMKTGDDAFAIWGGIAGVQSTLASLLSFENASALTRTRIAALIAGNAARRYKITHKAKIEVGFDADLTLVDPDTKYTLTREMLLDRHKLSPYVGRTFRGVIHRTIVRGTTVFQNGKIVSPPIGRLVKPQR